MKRTLLAAFAVGTMAIAGCSDYPSTGSVDTRTVREVADIEEITGKAYGVKETAKVAVENLKRDADLISGIKYGVWGHIAEGGDIKDLDLKLSYSGVDGSEMQAAIDQTVEAAQTYYDASWDKINSEKDQVNKKLAEASSEIERLKAADEQFKVATASEQKAYDGAVAEMNQARSAVEGIYEKAGNEMSDLAEKLGYTGRRKLTFGDSLIGRYKTIDYSNRNDLPKDCPPQRGHETIDTRDLNNRCSYLHVGTIFTRDPAIEKEARKILNTNFRALSETMAKIGESGSNPTGLYAKVEKAKADLNKAYAEAAKAHGSKQERERKIALLDREIKAMNAQLQNMESEDYFDDQTYYGDIEYPEGFHQAREKYIEAIRQDLFANHIVQVSDITMSQDSDVKDGYFENVESGYVGVLSVTDILASKNRSKEVLRAFGFADLKDPKVAEADVIQISTEREGIKRLGRNRSDEELHEDMLQFLTKTYEKTKAS